MTPKGTLYILIGCVFAFILFVDWRFALSITGVLVALYLSFGLLVYFIRSLELGRWSTWEEFRRGFLK